MSECRAYFTLHIHAVLITHISSHVHPIALSFISLQHTDIFSFITHNEFNLQKFITFLMTYFKNCLYFFKAIDLAIHICTLTSLFNGDLERLVIDFKYSDFSNTVNSQVFQEGKQIIALFTHGSVHHLGTI